MIINQFKKMFFLSLLLPSTVALGMERALILGKQLQYRSNQSLKKFSPSPLTKEISSLFPKSFTPEFSPSPLTKEISSLFLLLPKEVQERIFAFVKDDKDLYSLTSTCSALYFSEYNGKNKPKQGSFVTNNSKHRYHWLLELICKENPEKCATIMQKEEALNNSDRWTAERWWGYRYEWLIPNECGVGHQQRWIELFDVCRAKNLEVDKLGKSHYSYSILPTPLIMACIGNDVPEFAQLLTSTTILELSYTDLKELLYLAKTLNRQECLSIFVKIINDLYANKKGTHETNYIYYHHIV